MTAAVKTGVYVCGRCFGPGDEQFFLGSTSVQGVCSRCGGLAAWMVDTAINDPHLAVRGRSVMFRTVMALEPFPSMVWDVNGYYAELGISPRASRREIREAYQRLEGWSDPRLTYIVRQLLNDEIRKLYDAVELGSIFFDRYWDAKARRKMEEEAFVARMDDPDLETEPIDLDASLNRAFQVVDNERQREHYADTGWGFYLWGCNCRDARRLAQWRHELTGAFDREGRSISLAVGYMSTPGWAVEEVDGQVVAFLGETSDPTPIFAQAVQSHLAT